ncbi:neuralized-like protein 4 isoform X2 [Ischnura elegans]|uniref:neuralized-like protein 4 isoform X2 n=1 Tax=Ischnura elegans TaxID=197161 RepID=UPI001ED8A8D5|nr:neuralized-like protein 4 isoform X2 [Ischnura elegans]
MAGRFLFLAAAMILWSGISDHGAVAVSSEPLEQRCSGAILRNAFDFSIVSRRNESGEWVTKVEGQRVIDNGTDKVQVDFKQRVVECQGRQTVHFEGVFGENPIAPKDPLRFHPKCGKNVAITNNGKTIEKINGEERLYGVAFTNRPLRINELFEVVVNHKTGSKFNFFMAIGVTTASPNDGDIPNHLNSLKFGTWMLYHNRLYNNGNVVMDNRKTHLDHLKVGDRIGLMRNESGTLSLFINGTEEVIASNVPYPVYGVFECYGDAIKVTMTS